MFVLKAFATNSKFFNNTPNASTVIGSISTQSLTYARHKDYYVSAVDTDIGLITFTSVMDNVGYQMLQDLVDQLISITSFVYKASIAAGSQLFADILLNDLISTFATTANNFAAGPVVSNGNYSIPEWISFNSLNSEVTASGNNIKIWLSDNRFQVEYDNFEVVVVPPLTPLDNLFTGTANVTTLLRNITVPDIINNIQTAKGIYPETMIAALNYNFVDPTNPNNLIPTTWNILIYGAAGNNPDVIQNALIQYILGNSARTQTEWIKIFPTLFEVTEFIIVPNWNQYSIPNMTLQAGIYSPSISIASALALLTNTIVGYPPAHIAAHADIMSQPYKSLTLTSIGSPTNINTLYNTSSMFPDFIDVSSTSIDFARMSQTTQDWANMLANMLVVAETMTLYSSIPLGMTRVVRSGILYLVSRYQNIDYLIATKSSFL